MVKTRKTIVPLTPNGGKGKDEVELSVTKNGNYFPEEGSVYSKVSVSVPQTAESGTLKNFLDTKKSCQFLFYKFMGTSVEGLISYSDTSNVTSMQEMFENCTNLTTIPLLDTSKVTNMQYMFVSCSSLTTIPLLDTSNITSTYQMFYNCSKLTSVPALDVSNVTNMNSMFSGCSSLKSILMTGMKVSFNISASTKFEESDLVTILNNLASVTSTQTVTMGSTNLAKLTDEEKAIATNKGWTLA